MTTSILDETTGEGVYLTRLWREGGPAYQITDQRGEYVVLTERQLDLVACSYAMFRLGLEITPHSEEKPL